MKAIFKRELRSFFLTGIGYTFLGMFLALAGLLFYINNIVTRSGDMGGFFSMLSYVWLLIAPILVMRLFAGDKQQGTNQLLRTAPVSFAHIVAAKYAAVLVILFLALLFSLVYPLIILMYGILYLPEVLTGYLGIFMYGAAYLALNMLVSSFAHSPMTAFILSLGVNLLIRLSGLVSAAANIPFVTTLLRVFDLDARHKPFIFGQLSFSNVLYYLLFSLACLVLTTQSMQVRKWSKAS